MASAKSKSQDKEKQKQSVWSLLRQPTLTKLDPWECPFREFRDNELSFEFWGLGPAATRATQILPKATGKTATQTTSQVSHGVWVDDHTQPLPASVRHYLHGWVRAEELAASRWECDIAVYEESGSGSKMSVIDYQLSHAQVLFRSSFCRRILAACYILEGLDGFQVEHQWENFSFSFGSEGWRAKYHIYSPTMKPGGGTQHKPGISKNGCYLVRLYYLGAWRCVWVSDQVPVDTSGAPLLPFSPLSTHNPSKTKGISTTVTANVVQLWPMLLCKALLKIAAPDMNNVDDDDYEEKEPEDELIPEFDILHTLTGCLSFTYHISDQEALWKLLRSEVQVFVWDDDDDLQSSTVKSKSTKKPTTKDKESAMKRNSLISIIIRDTKDLAPYILPGVTPAHETRMIVKLVRDLPLKKPLPEPEVPLWKTYRWVDWAREHGLYEAYDCPRTRFLKVSGLMKLSYAPHLLDVTSTESITYCFREEQQKEHVNSETWIEIFLESDIEHRKDKDKNKVQPILSSLLAHMKEELREWILYETVFPMIKSVSILYFPSCFLYTSAASNPPFRITKSPTKSFDVLAPKTAPLYFQIDGPEEISLKISISALHPRVLLNAGMPVEDYVEKAYFILECFDWFIDKELPLPKGYLETRGYNAVELFFKPGRHYCRLWVHSQMHWQIAMLSESSIVLGTRDVVQAAAVRNCPWVGKYLSGLGGAFNNWIRTSRANMNSSTIRSVDQEFFSSYQPDLEWDQNVTGYNKACVHWMFRQALESYLFKRLIPFDFQYVCTTLRNFFHDPDFGFPPKPKPPRSYRDIAMRDPCDCFMVETEVEDETLEEIEELVGEQKEICLVDAAMMDQLLTEPKMPAQSQVCELATEQLPCFVLKEEREKMIRKHEAATCIQAKWRGLWARKCLNWKVSAPPEVIKLLLDNAFGNAEVLIELMNEFFFMFPGVRYAYSIASGLSGLYGLQQHTGTSYITPRCKWIPYFQGVFYCHQDVKVHLDIVCTNVEDCTVTVYDNDTGEQMPQAFNTHITYDICPNIFGYTVMGHGSLRKPLGHNADVQWTLTIMSSLNDVFHICDNPETEPCNALPLNAATKLRIEEIFIPNRKNILGGVQVAVTKIEAVSFRAAATQSDLELEATLLTYGPEGEKMVLAKSQGKGEIYWPYIRLKPLHPSNRNITKAKSYSTNSLNRVAQSLGYLSSRSLKVKGGKLKSTKSSLKMQTKSAPVESKIYFIEVTAPKGWPLNLTHWKRVNEVRNDIEIPKDPQQTKKITREKVTSAKGRQEDKKEVDKISIFNVPQPLSDDAYVEMECSITVGSGTVANRDDERDIRFANERKSWCVKDPGRNERGAKIRAQFREEFLCKTGGSPLKSVTSVDDKLSTEFQDFEMLSEISPEWQKIRNTPATDSAMFIEAEAEEEALYLKMPEQLRDKFTPLFFVPLCTKENEDESVILTGEMVEAAKTERQSRIEADLKRMLDLQEYNKKHVLGRQQKRCRLLEKLNIDGTWTPELATVLLERDEAIAREILEQQHSLIKKKKEEKEEKEKRSNVTRSEREKSKKT